MEMRKQIGWPRALPGVLILRQYKTTWRVHDIVSGVVLATILVPVGIAYAVASGLPGIFGLYATIVPLLAYAVFDPSRILVLGPDSSLAAREATTISSTSRRRCRISASRLTEGRIAATPLYSVAGSVSVKDQHRSVCRDSQNRCLRRDAGFGKREEYHQE
jgi:MFS superfamily sulfate permease-like transporter